MNLRFSHETSWNHQIAQNYLCKPPLQRLITYDFKYNSTFHTPNKSRSPDNCADERLSIIGTYTLFGLEFTEIVVVECDDVFWIGSTGLVGRMRFGQCVPC